jgi:drug/metabolite transporter (DMT)-like permease
VSGRADHRFAFPAVLIGSCALAFGPWLVRLSQVGPVAAGFWRLALALPFLFVIAAMIRQPVHWPVRKLATLVAIAAVFFAADLAAWHVGIHMTKLGNATLFGNVSSFAFAAWGLWLARRWPSTTQGLALGLAVIGAAMLMGSSFELSPRNFTGDLLALFAGLLYTGYLIAIQQARGSLSRCHCCSSPAHSARQCCSRCQWRSANRSSRMTGLSSCSSPSAARCSGRACSSTVSPTSRRWSSA